jgi:hypothetical protein
MQRAIHEQHDSSRLALRPPHLTLEFLTKSQLLRVLSHQLSIPDLYIVSVVHRIGEAAEA